MFGALVAKRTCGSFSRINQLWPLSRKLSSLSQKTDIVSGGFQGQVYANSSSIQTERSETFFHELDLDNKVVLDAGCGAGATTLAILKNKQPKKVFGFDASESQIASAREMDSKIEWFVATFDNFMEKKPELKGQVDVIASAFALQFAPSLHHFFASAADALKPRGTLWAIWPAVKGFMGPVLREAQKDPRFRSYIGHLETDDKMTNGVHVPGYEVQTLDHVWESLHDAGFDGEHVAKVMFQVDFKDEEHVKRFVMGVNAMRHLIPENLVAEYDELCTKETLKNPIFDGFLMHGAVMEVHTKRK